MPRKPAVPQPVNTKRRALLGAATSLALVPSARGAARPQYLPYSPGAFDATQDSILIWVHGDIEGSVSIRFRKESNAAFEAGPAVELTRANAFTAAIPLEGLTPGQTYQYRIVEAQSGTQLSPVHRFRTASASHTPFSFAFSADMADTGKPFVLFDVIAAKQPDFMLILGDTTYADEPAHQFAPSLEFYRAKHALNRKDVALQKFLAAHVTYATWDDHEIENDADSTHPHLEAAFRAFTDFWPCRRVEEKALYRSFSWGGCDFYMLDTRSFRSPQKAPDGPDKTMLGANQKEWLLGSLKSSSAPFKFVVTSVPVNGGLSDDWSRYATEWAEIRNFIQQEKLAGLIFLTGDYHMARAWQDKTTGLREFMAGPIGAFTHYDWRPNRRILDLRTPHFHFGDGRNFGYWQVDPAAGKAKLQFIDARARVLHETEVFSEAVG